MKTYGVEFTHSRSNGQRLLTLKYEPESDSGDGKILMTGNLNSTDPAVSVIEVESPQSLSQIETTAVTTETISPEVTALVPEVTVTVEELTDPVDQSVGNNVIKKFTEMTRNNRIRSIIRRTGKKEQQGSMSLAGKYIKYKIIGVTQFILKFIIGEIIGAINNIANVTRDNFCSFRVFSVHLVIRVSLRGGMKNVISYIEKESKTKLDSGRLITGINCSSDTAFDEFAATKNMFGKTGGRLYYHVVQSFPKGVDIDPQLAHKIACEFAEKTFGNFECVVATNIDREHIHSHFVSNSASFIDGKKCQERFYNFLKFYSFDDLQVQMRRYLRRSNRIPMAVLGWKSPDCRHKELELLS